MSPLTDAMRLVYRDEADGARRQEVEEALAAFSYQALGRDVKQLNLPLRRPDSTADFRSDASELL